MDVAQKPIKHGTEGGYVTHRYRGEEPCRACKDAWAKKARERRHAKKRHSDMRRIQKRRRVDRSGKTVRFDVARHLGPDGHEEGRT